MKTTRFGLGMILLLASVSGVLAQEHTFGLRAGTFTFPDGDIFHDFISIERPDTSPEVTLNLSFRRDFDPDDFSGTVYEFLYTFRRDEDAHFQMDLSAGLYKSDVTSLTSGTVRKFDPRGSGTTRFLPANISDTLEYTLYYVQVVPTWQFTTGKFRFFVGGGLGLWANLFREVLEADYPDIFTCSDLSDYSTCTGRDQFRESQGNRRTSVPINVSAGFFYQFLPHWSFNVEDRYVFNAESSVNLWREDSTFDVGQNQVFIGFSYRL